MKILMLSWEYPPKVVGGIARHVADLSEALAEKGEEVHVITCGVQGAPEFEDYRGVKVYRTTMNNPSAPDFLTWVFQLNLNMMEVAERLKASGQEFDLIHAHDWLTAYAGKCLKHAWRLPLIATIHATEYGRNNGLHNQLQRYISDVEWWLGYEAWRVICCSEYMRQELQRIFQMPADKIQVIPNGVYQKDFQKTTTDPRKIRSQYAAPDEKIIFHVGRIVREKGLGVLLEAMPRILAVVPRVKLVIAGQGGYLEELRHRTYQLGVYNRVYFTGYIDDDTRNALYQCSDVAVFPSLYEPFGIVALEGMAAGVPVVVSDTGGMSDIVSHGVNGLKAYVDNPISLADNIIWALQHPDHTQKMKQQALTDIDRKYSWPQIAAQTIAVYRRVGLESYELGWQPTEVQSGTRIPKLDRYQGTIIGEEENESSYYGRRQRDAAQTFNLQSAKADGTYRQSSDDGAHSQVAGKA